MFSKDEEYEALAGAITSLEECERAINVAIALTPSGPERNQLTDINIRRLQAIKVAREVCPEGYYNEAKAFFNLYPWLDKTKKEGLEK